MALACGRATCLRLGHAGHEAEACREAGLTEGPDRMRTIRLHGEVIQ